MPDPIPRANGPILFLAGGVLGCAAAGLIGLSGFGGWAMVLGYLLTCLGFTAFALFWHARRPLPDQGSLPPKTRPL